MVWGSEKLLRQRKRKRKNDSKGKRRDVNAGLVKPSLHIPGEFMGEEEEMMERGRESVSEREGEKENIQ